MRREHINLAAVRFLHQPNKPIIPRPVAKSGRAAGTGTGGGLYWPPQKATCTLPPVG